MRQQSLRYALVIAAVIALLATGCWHVWRTGEATSAHLVTATGSAASVPSAAVSAPLAIEWQVAAETALGSSFQGTTVTWSAHEVAGRDAIDGKVRWTYIRDDVTICSVGQQDGTTVAVFNKSGNCDEAIGLKTPTGERAWSRTLFDTGVSTMQIRSSLVLLVTSTSVHGVDPGSGLDRWYWKPAGCTVNTAVPGGLGVLVSTKCGAVERLTLRKLYDDGEVWQVNSPDAPVSTEQVVLAWDAATHSLTQYSNDKGLKGSTLALSTVPAGTVPTATNNGATVLVYVPGTLTAIEVASTITTRWSVPAADPPATAGSTGTDGTSSAPAAIIYVPTAGGVLEVNAASGANGTLHVGIPKLAGSERFERLGSGFVIGAKMTIVLK
jgi:hypothetical protein